MIKFLFVVYAITIAFIGSKNVGMMIFGLMIYFSMCVVLLMEASRRYRDFEKRVREKING